MPDRGRSDGPQTPRSTLLPEGYLPDLAKGYFSEEGVIRKEYLVTYPDGVSWSFTGMTYTQIRSFFAALRVAESAYSNAIEGGVKAKVAEEQLIANVQRLDGIVTYARGRDRYLVPETFRTFMRKNIEACQTAKDVLEGFMLHFEAVLGYFRYNFPNK